MLFPSHLLAGSLIHTLLAILFPQQMAGQSILISLFFSWLPDLDIFFAKKVNEHHNSPFHAPFFWLIMCVIVFQLNRVLSAVLFAQVMFHLILDFVAGRVAGIPIFYPFSRKEYSMFPLNKKDGNYGLLDFKASASSFKAYLSNRLLLFIEAAVCAFGIALLYF